jgi:hypothetical protein
VLLGPLECESGGDPLSQSVVPLPASGSGVPVAAGSYSTLLRRRLLEGVGEAHARSGGGTTQMMRHPALRSLREVAEERWRSGQARGST